jgi:hypothetical protein
MLLATAVGNEEDFSAAKTLWSSEVKSKADPDSSSCSSMVLLHISQLRSSSVSDEKGFVRCWDRPSTTQYRRKLTINRYFIVEMKWERCVVLVRLTTKLQFESYIGLYRCVDYPSSIKRDAIVISTFQFSTFDSLMWFTDNLTIYH